MRISEIYPSIQGEGPRVGLPTVFVRTGGCNLRCPGWPCDTPHAIDAKKYRHEWVKQSSVTVLNRISELRMSHVCFTGGEPMLQGRGLSETVNMLRQADYSMEMFSNGTLEYTRMILWHVDVVMDWKLPGSGEQTDVEQRWINAQNMHRANVGMGRTHCVKFTIADSEDYERARDVYERIVANKWQLPIYYGVVWGKLDNAKLIDWMLRDKLPWRHTMQVHNYVWDRTERGI